MNDRKHIKNIYKKLFTTYFQATGIIIFICRDTNTNAILKQLEESKEFSMTAPQILARSKIGHEAAYCLNNRGCAAGLKSGYAGEEKTDSSICLSI